MYPTILLRDTGQSPVTTTSDVSTIRCLEKVVPARRPYDRKWSAPIDHSHGVADAGCAIIIFELLRVLVLIIAYSYGGSGPLLSGKETLSTDGGILVDCIDSCQLFYNN
jgi:hypothetical protein